MNTNLLIIQAAAGEEEGLLAVIHRHLGDGGRQRVEPEGQAAAAADDPPAPVAQHVRTRFGAEVPKKEEALDLGHGVYSSRMAYSRAVEPGDPHATAEGIFDVIRLQVNTEFPLSGRADRSEADRVPPVAMYPAEALTARLTPQTLALALGLTVFALAGSRLFWKFGLRHYSGASA